MSEKEIKNKIDFSTQDERTFKEFNISNLIVAEEDISFISEKKEKQQDLNTIINEIGWSPNLIKVLIFGILICFSDGSEMVVVSLITRKLETKWNLNPLKKAFLGGSIFYGFLFGSLLSGSIMDRKGRKYTFVLGSIIFFIFGIFSSFALEFYSLLLFRIGVGLGIGFLIPTTQTYLTELSPQAYRGFISIIIWVGFPLGEMYICYIANIFPLDDKTYHQSNWKITLTLAALPIIFNLVLLCFLYESPRFHLEKNNFDEAFEIINILKKDSKLQPIDEKTKSEIKCFYIEKKTHTSSTNLSNLLHSKFTNITLSLWVMWFVVSYIFFGVLYLIPELIGKKKENVNFSDLVNAVIFSTFFEIIGIFSTLIMELDFCGRLGSFRISFLLSMIFSLLCMIKFRGWIIFLHFLKGSIQIANRALYPYTSESYPTENRGMALGIASSLARIAGLSTPLINEFLLSFSPNLCFICLFIASLIGAFLSFRLKAETLNKKID